MTSSLLLPLLTSITVSMSLFGCADDDFANEDCRGDKCDDLSDRDLVLSTKGEPIRLALSPAAYSVSPEIQEEGNAVRVTTSDLRFNLKELAEVGYLKLKVDSGLDLETRYGFRLEYHVPGETDWTPLVPVSGDHAWNWHDIVIEDYSLFKGTPTIEISGNATKYKDSFGGLWDPQEDQKLFRNLDYGVADMEFRVLVLPLWNFWDWNETGYETTLVVDQCFTLCEL